MKFNFLKFSILLKSILLIFAVFLALIISEIFLRIFTPVPENLAKLKSSSLFLHENRPNTTFPYIRGGEFEVLVSINSHGFRDDEFKVEKEEGVIRVAVLGDSQEEALQVELHDTWQKVMARKLSEDLGVKVETYNFGVSGYGTDQQWLTLWQKVWQFSPDMVILAFSPNDVGDTYKNRLVEVAGGKLVVVSARERAGGNFLGKLVRQTYIYHMSARASGESDFSKSIFGKIRVSVLGFPKDERFFISDAQLVQGPFEVIASQKNPPVEVREAWKVIEALIDDMARQTEEHGAKFLITVNIPRVQVVESDWKSLVFLYKLDPATSSEGEINEVLSGITKRLDISFYDPRLDAVEWKQLRGDLHFEADAHYNRLGNEFMGTAVAEFILAGDLIK